MEEIRGVYPLQCLQLIDAESVVDRMPDPDQGPHLDPDDAGSYFNQGNDDVDSCNVSAAITNFSQAIFLNPNFAFAYNNRGLVFHG